MYPKSLSLRKSFIKWKFQKFFENFLGLKKFIFLGMFSWMDFHLLESIQTFSTLFFMSFSKFYQNSNSSRKSFTNGNFNIFWKFLGLKKLIFLGMFYWLDSHLFQSIQIISTLFFIRKSWIFMEKVWQFSKNFVENHGFFPKWNLKGIDWFLLELWEKMDFL